MVKNYEKNNNLPIYHFSNLPNLVCTWTSLPILIVIGGQVILIQLLPTIQTFSSHMSTKKRKKFNLNIQIIKEAFAIRKTALEN